MTVSSNILTMCLYSYPNPSQAVNPFPSSPPKLVRINLDDPERTEEADVPIPPTPRSARNAPPPDPSTVGPHKMFADPLVYIFCSPCAMATTTTGRADGGKRDCFPNSRVTSSKVLLGTGRVKAPMRVQVLLEPANVQPMPTLPSPALERSCWEQDPETSTKRSSPPLSAATQMTEISLTRSRAEPQENGAERGDVDRVVRHMTSLPERQPVTGLVAEVFPRPSPPSTSNAPSTSAASDLRRAAVIATTSTRIYEYVGILSKSSKDENDSSSLYDKLFLPYRGDSSPNLKSELPGDLPFRSCTRGHRHHQSTSRPLPGSQVQASITVFYPTQLMQRQATVSSSLPTSYPILPWP